MQQQGILSRYSVLSKLGFSPQSRKERQEVIFLFVPVQPEQIKSFFLRQKKPLLQPESGRTQSESIPEGLSLVIQLPLAIGSQKKISLCVLCASAVNLVLRGTNDNPKPQWNQPTPRPITHGVKLAVRIEISGLSRFFFPIK
jgi:hypothetical protein